MKQKTAWKVTVTTNAETAVKEFLVTAGSADMAAKRAVALEKKAKEDRLMGAPYAQTVECRGAVYVFE